MRVSIDPNELIVCRDCDAVHRQVVLRKCEIARCTACGAVLGRHRRLGTEQLLALTAATGILFLIANATPILAIELSGMHTQANGLTAALSLEHGWTGWDAAVLGLTVFLAPLLQVALMLWVLTYAWFGRRAPGLRTVLVALHRLRPWSMSEVLLLGALVAIVKLSGWVHVVPSAGIWALSALTFLLTILALVDTRFWWTLGERGG